jgi:hypothetical protein
MKFHLYVDLQENCPIEWAVFQEENTPDRRQWGSSHDQSYYARYMKKVAMANTRNHSTNKRLYLSQVHLSQLCKMVDHLQGAHLPLAAPPAWHSPLTDDLWQMCFGFAFFFRRALQVHEPPPPPPPHTHRIPSFSLGLGHLVLRHFLRLCCFSGVISVTAFCCWDGVCVCGGVG